jgi:hypothetical protein
MMKSAIVSFRSTSYIRKALTGALFLQLWLVPGLLCGIVGCSDSGEPARTDVIGDVTYKGEPVTDGEVIFVPDEGSNATPGAAMIVDGKYEMKGNGGLMAGRYRVEFRAYQPSATTEEPGSPGNPLGSNPRDQILPERFQAKSTEVLEVTASQGPIAKDFNLLD